jgi:hypothetical protein
MTIAANIIHAWHMKLYIDFSSIENVYSLRSKTTLMYNPKTGARDTLNQ